jgi:hypothetical protein
MAVTVAITDDQTTMASASAALGSSMAPPSPRPALRDHGAPVR